MDESPKNSAVTVRQGLRIGLFGATCLSLLVVLGRVALGPGAFNRFGISWLTIIAVYFVTLSIGGLAIGALSPYRRNPAGAMVRGIAFMLPGYVVFTTLIGFGTGKLPSLKVCLILGLVLGVVGGSILGLWMWIDETGGRADRIRNSS